MSNQTWALQQADFFVVVTLMLSSCFSGSRQFNDMKNAHRLIVFTCLHCHSRSWERLVSQCVGLGLRPCKVEAQRFLNMTIRHLAWKTLQDHLQGRWDVWDSSWHVNPPWLFEDVYLVAGNAAALSSIHLCVTDFNTLMVFGLFVLFYLKNIESCCLLLSWRSKVTTSLSETTRIVCERSMNFKSPHWRPPSRSSQRTYVK